MTPAPVTSTDTSADSTTRRCPSEETAVEHLVATLQKLDVDPAPDAHWFRAAAACREATLKWKRDLEHSLSGMRLPLHADKQAAAKHCAECCRLLSDGYKKVAEKLDGMGSRNHRDNKFLLQACYLGLVNLADYFLIHYEHYFRFSDGEWVDAHRLYDIARSAGLHARPLDKRRSRKETVEHAYKRLVLLALSDPFHHPFGTAGMVYERLDRWADLASLLTYPPRSPHCVFMIDSTLDRPAIPVLSRTRISSQRNEKWLNTKALVGHIKHKYDKLDRAVAADLTPPEIMPRRLDSMDLLRRLVLYWAALHPIRASTRKSSHARCEVLIGLKSVCMALNGFQPITTTGYGDETLEMLRGSYGYQLQRVAKAPLASHWHITDESTDGFRLVARDSENTGHLAVGELIAIRMSDADPWRIGSVQWARADDDMTLSLGIKRIDMPSRPALVVSMDAEGPMGNTQSAGLLLTGSTSCEPGLSLISSSSIFSPGGRYLVHSIKDGEAYHLEASNLLQSSRSFAWFDVIEAPSCSREHPESTLLTLN